MLRPRIFVYGALLVALIAAWTWGVTTRSPLIVEVLRDRNALYRETRQASRNGYSLKLVNKTDAEARYGSCWRRRRPASQPIPAEIVLEPQATLPVTVTAKWARAPSPPRSSRWNPATGVRGSVDSSFFGPI